MTPRNPSSLSNAVSGRPKVQTPRAFASSFTQGNVTTAPRGTWEDQQRRKRAANAPAPMQSLVASAKRLTERKLSGGTFRKTTAQGWQEDAWEMYDLVGEQHFLGSTLANQASKARFYVGSLGEASDTTDLPDPVEDLALQGLIEAVGGGPIGFAQMVQRLLVNLFVAGDGWLVGIPKQLLPDYEPEDEDEEQFLRENPLPTAQQVRDPEDESQLNMGDLEWRMLSVSEVTLMRDGKVKLHLGAESSEKIDVSPDLLFLIRVWRPHPRRWWEADSPTRASLPILRELVGLTMHISAQVDSRLAGAGLLLVPASAARALKIASGIPEDSDEDPFTEALMEAMLTPIGDRANASALVPLVVTVPDGTASEFTYLNFSRPLDTEARGLREEAIRRLALGQDAPPELLLGTAGMNHWGAWLVRDDVVTTHIEPPLALVADALTTQYLRPMMAEMGYDKEVIRKTVVWYDTSDMVVRPNRAADALTLYDRDALSDEALREATGFDETDAPDTSKMDLASQTAFQLVKENPGLMANPGLPALVDQLRGLISGNPQQLLSKAEREAAAQQAVAVPTSNPSLPGAAPVAQPVSNTGAPPVNPSVKQGPALSAEGIVNAFSAVENGKEFVEGYIEKFGSAPGLLKDGTPPLCAFCDQRATGWFLFAEGMAFVPFDERHRTDAHDAAASATPSGEMDEENIDGEGSYAASRRTQVLDASTNPVDDQSDLTAAPTIGKDLEPETPGSQGAIVVLIPAEDDPINQAATELGVDAHMTLAYLAGDLEKDALPDYETLVNEARQAAAEVGLEQIVLQKQRVMPLGDAVVLGLMSSGPLEELYSALTEDTVIGQLDSSRNKYPFRPHVSLKYVEGGEASASSEAAKATVYPYPEVVFDRIGVWIGDEHYDSALGASGTVSPEPAEPVALETRDEPAAPAPGPAVASVPALNPQPVNS